MKKKVLLAAMATMMTIGAGAQQKVAQYFRVSDANFNVNHFQDDANPNSGNPLDNSFTIPTEYGSVAWEFGGPWWEHGIDMSKYEKLVIRIKSVVGNNLQFKIVDYPSLNGEGGEYNMPDDIVELDEEVEYMVDFTDDLECVKIENDQKIYRPLDLTDVKKFVFWNYWDVNKDADGDGEPDYTEPQADVTVTISAMYLERTLANGEKDYLDLLSANKLSFTDEFLNDEEPGSASYRDNGGVLHLNENANAGFYFDETPADWSAYRYLVVVPQVPYGDGMPVIKYVLTDNFDNVFDSGSFRHGFWNRARAAVQDLTAITATPLDDGTLLSDFYPSAIYSLEWSLWGGVQSVEYGLAGVWLSNTAPTFSTAFGNDTDNTGDFIIDNGAENTVSTICLPFAAALCGANVYEIAGVDSKSNPTELYAKPYAGILEAGKPYIIRSNSARNITAFRAGANEASVPVANGALAASSFTTYYVAQDKNYLVLNADGDTFEAVTDRVKRVNSNTAYVDFTLLEETEDPGDGLVFSVTGVDPTISGISNVGISTPTVKDNAIYTISGVRVAKAIEKGIYIQNGKKFVVK